LKIVPLTAIRFAAASYVVIYHTVYASGVAQAAWFSRFISFGETAVSLFFILSGYILAYVYLRPEKPFAARASGSRGLHESILYSFCPFS
jgi:peptidoglycan/LPS O-acetylase OafA/YrhL